MGNSGARCRRDWSRRRWTRSLLLKVVGIRNRREAQGHRRLETGPEVATRWWGHADLPSSTPSSCRCHIHRLLRLVGQVREREVRMSSPEAGHVSLLLVGWFAFRNSGIRNKALVIAGKRSSDGGRSERSKRRGHQWGRAVPSSDIYIPFYFSTLAVIPADITRKFPVRGCVTRSIS